LKKRQTLIYIVSAIFSAALLAYLLINLDWEFLRIALSDLRWGWLALALLANLANILLRALRFSTLIYSRPVKWMDLVPVAGLHHILTYLMPAKTGDVTYIFLAKDRLDLSLTEGTATLFAARFYDFAVVALFIVILFPFSRSEIPDWIFIPAMLFCGLVLLATLGILLFLRFQTSPTHGDTETQGKTTKGLRATASRWFNVWDKFIAGLREIQAHGAHGQVALLTAGIWLCVYSNFYFATKGMGMPVAFYHIAIISMVMIPLTLLPLQGFANIGTHEVGWTSVLTAFGYPYKTALAIAAGSHFVLLLSVLVSGGAAFLGARFFLKRT